MWEHLKHIVAISALCFGMAWTPANASETRVSSFILPCDGQQHSITFDATALGTASTRFVQGAELIVTSNPGGVEYILLRGNGDFSKTLLILSTGNSRAFRDFTGFFSIPNNNGTITFEMLAVCSSGPGVNGIVVIDFFS